MHQVIQINKTFTSVGASDITPLVCLL